MRLERISIRNFRLLRRFSIDLAEGKTTTIFVGPNNSGKTSVMEAFRLFVGTDTKRKPAIHDLSQIRSRDFKSIQRRIETIEDEDECLSLVKCFAPRIRMDLFFSYEEGTSDLAVASELLMNLDPESNEVGLRIEFALNNAKSLRADFKARRSSDETLFEFLSDRLATYYSFFFYKISSDGKEAEPLDSGDIVKRLIKFDMISAQRFIDDDESSHATKLSRLLHNHYNRYYKEEDVEGYNAIEDAVKASAADLTEKYEGAFGRLTDRLETFGYPQGQSSPNMRIRAEMDADTVYRDNTRIYYENRQVSARGEQRTFELPERYNGLGYKNLIYIVLQLESFRAAMNAMQTDRPRIHLIAIEEPEAHLHPPMQRVFIKEISNALGTVEGSHAQVILSTHSSHIVADSGFKPIRYFKKKGNQVLVRDLSQMRPEASEVLPFLLRYMKLTHCDLFFADKAILVEGQVERLLFPIMLEKYAEEKSCIRLTGQYISISEVGGAHAHKFQPLIEFIGIPTLIVTDIDTVDGSGKKCRVSGSVGTSNIALKNWIPAKETPDDLLSATDTMKTNGLIRIAYQVPEGESGQCGRSFEESFIYANLKWLAENHSKLETTGDRIRRGGETDLAEHAYDVCESLPKVNFALDLVTAYGWSMPRYIVEGLKWLAKQKSA